jgi:two-component system cell cycle response regulator
LGTFLQQRGLAGKGHVTERILIADRSDDLRHTLRAPLEAEGFVLSEARDLAEALEELHAHRHRAALVDIELPGGGFDLLDALKTDPDLSGISVVLLSDDLADGAALEGLARGATDCLRKPIEPIEAVVRTRAALRVSHLGQMLREGNDRLAELAATDDLTGLLARRFLESHLRGLVSSAARHGRPLSVVMLDLDNFKNINDVHGHAVGDAVLRAAVECIRSRLRQQDLLGRWGGDELILVLPDIPLDGAAAAAEALRARIEETRVEADGEPVAITVSAGAAEWSDETAHELIERADAAMYEAKAGGRNRVHTDGLARPA